MDPTKDPDFKPLGDDKTQRELVPPLAPQSCIPANGPIMPYVLADYNNSLDAPIQPRHYKKILKHERHQFLTSQDKEQHIHNSIPLLQKELQPISNETSSESDPEAELKSIEKEQHKELPLQGFENKVSIEQHLSNTPISIKIHKHQIADLEEVPHGIVRQADCLDNYEFPIHRLQQKLQNANKLPLVLVACGSFSPITYLHLRMFEMALDSISEQTRFEVIGGYYSPVSDHYRKSGLAPFRHRVRMCELACERTSSWLMVDAWESLQPSYTRTAKVLDHFNDEINLKRGGIMTPSGEAVGVKIMLLAGGDLIESMGEPNVWADADLHHILGNYGCLIVERTGSDVRSFLLSHDIMYEHRRNILVIKQLIYNDISSTKVRLFIRRGMSVQYLLPNSVIRYIQEHGLYVNQSEPVKQVIDHAD